MKTVQGLINHCKQALHANVRYVYGAKMQVLTKAQIQALQNQYGTKCVWTSDLAKAGKMCCDCSGLISSYTGITRGSSQYASTTTATATIAQLKNNWSKYVGWGIWLPGHIGVVSDVEGYYYAMDGSARNMVHNPLNKQNWVKVIKLCDIDYSKGAVKMETKITNYNDAMDKLIKSGVVSSREYWDNAVKCVKFLDVLIINMANKM